MIRTAMQLKAKLRVLAGKTGASALELGYVFMLERFLERISKSGFSDNFVLKGGMLMTSLMGVAARTTTDLDVTLNAGVLSAERARDVIQTVASIDVQDGISFQIDRFDPVMEERDYPGIRAKGTATLEKMIIPVKLDISTGDVITPGAIEYSYPLMFEDRSIDLQSYSLETVLAEKMMALAIHGTDNTRMRDYYDVHMILKIFSGRIDPQTLADALEATAGQRNIVGFAERIEHALPDMADSQKLQSLWEGYGKKASYARHISWPEVVHSVGSVLDFAYPFGSNWEQTKHEPKQPALKKSKRKQTER